MKNSFLILIFLLTFSSVSISQIVFEKGYFIDYADNKIECLIKNNDWRNNPTSFQYKLSESAQTRRGALEEVKEFGIYGTSKYIKAIVQIDRARNEINVISSLKEPDFREEELFLKVLIEGKATLYSYQEPNFLRLFFRVPDKDITQLVFREYKVYDRVSQNNQYKRQLASNLICTTINTEYIDNLEYDKRNLKRAFKDYNECANASYIDHEPIQKKDLPRLSFRPGINLRNFIAQNEITEEWSNEFESNISMRIGLELELILPFNKNKWSITLEPTYNSYNTELIKDVSTVSGGFLKSVVQYNSLEIPIGLRHYLFLNDDSKLFVNVNYVFHTSNKSTLELLRADDSSLGELILQGRRNLTLGIGYNQNNKYSIELRQHAGLNLLAEFPTWDSTLSTTSLIFGYTLF